MVSSYFSGCSLYKHDYPAITASPVLYSARGKELKTWTFKITPLLHLDEEIVR